MVARMEFKSIAGAVYVQLAYAAMFLASRLAFTKGMSHYAFVLYRQIVATLAIGLPAAYYLYRGGRWSCMTWRSMKHVFILALIGISFSQNFYYAGLALTSSTFASTMNNLIPVVTFLLAYFLKLERVRIKVWDGQAKILGTLFCVGGAMLMTFYENTTSQSQEVSQAQHLLYVDHFPLAQSLLKHVGKIHGSFLFGALLTIIGSWSMSFFMIYQGIFCTGLGFFIIMWCVKERGPVFITMFSPLSSVVVAIMEPLVLHAQLTWGSVLGMAIIIAGLYLYLWAKAQDSNPSTDQSQLTDEEEERTIDANERSSREEITIGIQAPLLANINTNS
ncbi:hypothetical protein ZIOFF_019144 [Zingiber officinale]|uniref:WAT1-related protein n=1 Tax=Zingiber officinale TaxID=94328 RepID=A0A8J5HDV3_ZINOF|nr:hypothetical protein ZIOFF_019144 [Zingiber officinale]